MNSGWPMIQEYFRRGMFWRQTHHCSHIKKAYSAEFLKEKCSTAVRSVNSRGSKLEYPSGSSSFDKRHITNMDERE